MKVTDNILKNKINYLKIILIIIHIKVNIKIYLK